MENYVSKTSLSDFRLCGYIPAYERSPNFVLPVFVSRSGAPGKKFIQNVDEKSGLVASFKEIYLEYNVKYIDGAEKYLLNREYVYVFISSNGVLYGRKEELSDRLISVLENENVNAQTEYQIACVLDSQERKKKAEARLIVSDGTNEFLLSLIKVGIWDTLLASAKDEEGVDWVRNVRRKLTFGVESNGLIKLRNVGPLHPSVQLKMPLKLGDVIHNHELGLASLEKQRIISYRTKKKAELKKEYLTRIDTQTSTIDRLITVFELMIIDRELGLWLLEYRLVPGAVHSRIIRRASLELRRAKLMFGPDFSLEAREWHALERIMTLPMSARQRREFNEKVRRCDEIPYLVRDWFCWAKAK